MRIADWSAWEGKCEGLEGTEAGGAKEAIRGALGGGPLADVKHGDNGGAGERGEEVLEGVAAEGAAGEGEDGAVRLLGGKGEGVAAESGHEPAASGLVLREEREQGGHAGEREGLHGKVGAEVAALLPPEDGDGSGENKREQEAAAELCRNRFAEHGCEEAGEGERHRQTVPDE